MKYCPQKKSLSLLFRLNAFIKNGEITIRSLFINLKPRLKSSPWIRRLCKLFGTDLTKLDYQFGNNLVTVSVNQFRLLWVKIVANKLSHQQIIMLKANKIIWSRPLCSTLIHFLTVFSFLIGIRKTK